MFVFMIYQPSFLIERDRSRLKKKLETMEGSKTTLNDLRMWLRENPRSERSASISSRICATSPLVVYSNGYQVKLWPCLIYDQNLKKEGIILLNEKEFLREKSFLYFLKTPEST
jgi:hypothetical protein